jgi:hypothetical protein
MAVADINKWISGETEVFFLPNEPLSVTVDCNPGKEGSTVSPAGGEGASLSNRSIVACSFTGRLRRLPCDRFYVVNITGWDFHQERQGQARTTTWTCSATPNQLRVPSHDTTGEISHKSAERGVRSLMSAVGSKRPAPVCSSQSASCRPRAPILPRRRYRLARHRSHQLV